MEIAGLGAVMPATALSKDRLAFVRIVVDTDVYRFRIDRPSEPVVASSFLEAETRFSPDGRRLAFASMRSADTLEVWLAAADGSDAQQLTHGPGYVQGSPWWAPDGRRIAFDSMTDDWHSHIFTIDADGSTPHRLTTDPGDQNVPYWSRDGRWIYFSADRGAGRDIWRVAATGGPSQQVTGAAAAISRVSRPTARVFCTSRETQTRPCWRCHSPEVPRGSSSPA
jgi:Tol biopolymer transport system component